MVTRLQAEDLACYGKSSSADAGAPPRQPRKSMKTDGNRPVGAEKAKNPRPQLAAGAGAAASSAAEGAKDGQAAVVAAAR